MIPDHKLLRLISRGSYGEVWLGQNTLGSFRAIKIVYSATFHDKRPFEREYSGVKKFEPVSRLHENLVDVLQVGRNDEAGYFYCVMELADDASAAATVDPATYRPRTLASDLACTKRLPISTCLELGAAIASALEFLHQRGLIHRDVKPSNIVFINGVPKLADIGLVAELSEARSYVGTEGFIPPEGPGTVQSDIYSLGKVLYEISTGKDRHEYPALPTFLGEGVPDQQVLGLNKVVLRACRTSPKHRYRTAAHMRADLLEVKSGKALRDKPSLGLCITIPCMAMLIIAGLISSQLFRKRPRPTWQPPAPEMTSSQIPVLSGLVGLWSGDTGGSNAMHNGRKALLRRVEFVPGRTGRALSLDSNKGYLEVPDAPYLRLTNELTIEFWVKRQQLATADFIVEKGGDWVNEELDYAVALDGQDSANCLMFGFACGCRIGGVVADLNWHHCAVVARNGETDPAIYIDGTRQPIFYSRGESTIHLNPSSKPLHIGAQIDMVNGYSYFSSKLINHVALYNRALSEAEIQLLASSCFVPASNSMPRANEVQPAQAPVASPAEQSVPPGLVSWWRAEGDAKDSAGTNNGVLIGSATFGPGKIGRGFLLNGAGSYIRIPHSPSLNLSDEFTLELWFRNESRVPYNYGLIAKRGSEAAPINYNLTAGPRGVTVMYNDPDVEGGDDPLSSFECSIWPIWPKPLVWHHLAGTFRQVETNQVDVNTFFDGRLVKSSHLPGDLRKSINSYPLTIGADAEYPTYNYFEGTIDEVRIYRRALTAAEIRAIYELGEGPPAAPIEHRASK